MQGRGQGHAAGIGMLQDGHGRLVLEFIDQGYGRIHVYQVVIRQLLAVQLVEELVELAIEYAFLVGVLAIAQRGCLPQALFKHLSVALLEVVENMGVVMGRDIEGFGGKTLAVG